MARSSRVAVLKVNWLSARCSVAKRFALSAKCYSSHTLDRWRVFLGGRIEKETD